MYHAERVAELRLSMRAQRAKRQLLRGLQLPVDGVHHSLRVQRLCLIWIALENALDDELRVVQVPGFDRLGDARDVRLLRSRIEPTTIQVLVLGDHCLVEAVSAGVLEQ